jgi:succinoglycan biosynthesis transport protein ExoP
MRPFVASIDNAQLISFFSPFAAGLDRRRGDIRGRPIMQQAGQQAQTLPFPDREDEAEPLTRLWLACRRQCRLAAAILAVSVLGWLIYLGTVTPLYQSSASILIRAEEPAYLRKTSATENAPGLDETLASEMELMKSGDTLRRMIEANALLGQPDFIVELDQQRPAAPLQWLWTALGRNGDGNRMADALALIDARLTVKRLGESSVLSVAYAARSSDAAAAMVDRVVQAYFDARRRSQAETARRAADWLSGKVAELRRQSLVEDAAVEAFRRRHGLLASDGRLIGDQRLTRMTEQLVIAQSELGEANARSRKLEAILTEGDMNAAVAQSLASPLVTELRQHYLEAARRGADLEAKYGADHQQTRRLKGEAEEYRRQMFEELSRIAAAYRSEAEMARGRVEALKADLGQAGAEKSDLDAVQVTLRDLESRAANARALYLDRLTRLDTARQEENLPDVSATIISPPTLPTSPTSPRKALSLFVAVSLGLALALAVAVLRDFSDRSLRRPDQLRRLAGAPVLGLIPLIERAPLYHPDFTAFPISRPDTIRMADVLDRHAFDNPRSRMTDALRRTLAHHASSDATPATRIIGVVSCDAGEGKTTIAANLASLAAMKGRRTLLVDADMINPEASRRLAGHLVDADGLDGRASSPEFSILRHPSAPLALLAVPEQARPSGEGDIRGHVKSAIDQASADIDLVVIDMPPLSAGHAAEQAAQLVEAIILVVEWGRLTEASLAEALRASPSIAAKISGTLFNKVRLDRLPLYLGGSASISAYQGQSGYFT